MWEIKSSITKRDIPYELPANWSWFNWGDLILDYEQGLIRSNSQLGGGNAFYLKMGDLDNNGGCSLSGLAETQATPNEITAYRLHEGDFLINVRNSMDLVGKTCVIGRIEQKDVLFNHMLVLTILRSHGMDDPLGRQLTAWGNSRLPCRQTIRILRRS